MRSLRRRPTSLRASGSRARKASSASSSWSSSSSPMSAWSANRTRGNPRSCRSFRQLAPRSRTIRSPPSAKLGVVSYPTIAPSWSPTSRNHRGAHEGRAGTPFLRHIERTRSRVSDTIDAMAGKRSTISSAARWPSTRRPRGQPHVSCSRNGPLGEEYAAPSMHLEPSDFSPSARRHVKVWRHSLQRGGPTLRLKQSVGQRM